MKQAKSYGPSVCMICGKPSKEIICDPCKAKVRGETLHKKLEEEKRGKVR